MKAVHSRSLARCALSRQTRTAAVSEGPTRVEICNAHCGEAEACPKLEASLKRHCHGTLYDWKRQELERVYEQEQASSSQCDGPEDLSGSQHHCRASTFLQAVQTGSEPEKPKQKRENERHDDFYANVGDAIRTLREDVPLLFKQDLNYNIYRPDVVFRDPRNRFAGIDNYKLIFWSLRFHGRIFFKDLYVEVKRIWQKHDDSICMRWTVHGISRLPWEPEGTFDGVSTYKLDSHGKIYEHKVDNVIFRDPPMARNPLLLRLNLQPVEQAQPCPGTWGLCRSSASVKIPASLYALYIAATSAALVSMHTNQSRQCTTLHSRPASAGSA